MKLNNLQSISIGLVLSGGGAKGAYEVGVFKTLWELGLVDYIKVVSGTSIGAVNGLFLCMNDRKKTREGWSNLSYSRFIFNQERSRIHKMPILLKKLTNNSSENSVANQLRLSDIGLLSQKGVRNFIEEYVEMSVIKSCNKTLYACAYNIDDKKPEYFLLNNYNEDEMLQIILASCAVPLMFKPIKFRGKRYADGGIKTPEYTINNVDNIPIVPLRNHNCDFTIVVHLSPKEHIQSSSYNIKNIIEIVPSSPLEFFNGIGGLTLKQNTLKEHINLGYRDSMTILAPLVVNILKGKDLQKEIEKVNTANLS